MKLAINVGYSGAQMRLPLDLVLEVERMGYDSTWPAAAYGSDAVTPLAYLAAKTTRIKVGTGIMQIPGRTPATCAMTMSSLDQLSGGRALGGLGLSARRSWRVDAVWPTESRPPGPWSTSKSCARSGRGTSR